jgi:hypothetical protein
MNLDWDEDTVDLVMIAIGKSLAAAREVEPVLKHLGFSAQLLAQHEELVTKLRKALSDLLGQEEEEEGIFPVKELLGAHEVRLLKEDG